MDRGKKRQRTENRRLKKKYDCAGDRSVSKSSTMLAKDESSIPRTHVRKAKYEDSETTEYLGSLACQSSRFGMFQNSIKPKSCIFLE